MKKIYKGFEIVVNRVSCGKGVYEVHYLVTRLSDGFSISDGAECTKDTIATMIQCMKDRVDDYLENPEDYED